MERRLRRKCLLKRNKRVACVQTPPPLGSESNLVSVIFINKERKIGKSSQISTKYNTKLSVRFFFFSPQKSMKTLQLKPRANGRKIVGQKLPTFLDVTCCVRLNNLLHVVASCCAKFETDQTKARNIVGQKIPTLLGVVASVCA